MQCLRRLRSCSSSGAVADIYEPIIPGSLGSAPWESDSGSGGRDTCRGSSRCCCCNTQGKAFNFLVGVVICASALLLALEAELGLLTMNGPKWDALNADFNQFEVPKWVRQAVEDDVRKGIDEGSRLQGRVEQGINDQLDKLPFRANLPEPSAKLEPAAYTVGEYCIVAFFVFELLLRICDRCRAYFRDAWALLDIAVVLQGILDITLPFVIGQGPSEWCLEAMSFVRTMRILRVVRILRVSKKLSGVSRAFLNASAAMASVGAILMVFNFVLAILLTAFIGAKSHKWSQEGQEDIEAWFGTIGKSMTTLFMVMTLSGWEQIVQTLTEVIPTVVVAAFVIIYILLSFFTVLGLMAGTISNYYARACQESTERRHRWKEERRVTFAEVLTRVFASCEQKRKGFLSRDEFAAALDAHPALFAEDGYMKSLDIHAGTDDLLALYDRLIADSEVDGAVKVDGLAEALAALGGAAQASGLVDLKHQVQAARRETTEQATTIKHEIKGFRDQSRDLTMTTAGTVMKVTQEVSTLQSQVASVAQAVKMISERLDDVSRAQNEKFQQVISMSEKLDKVHSASERLQEVERRAEFKRQEQHEAQASAMASIYSRLESLAVEVRKSKPAWPQDEAGPAAAVIHEEEKAAEDALGPQQPHPGSSEAKLCKLSSGSPTMRSQQEDTGGTGEGWAVWQNADSPDKSTKVPEATPNSPELENWAAAVATTSHGVPPAMPGAANAQSSAGAGVTAEPGSSTPPQESEQCRPAQKSEPEVSPGAEADQESRKFMDLGVDDIFKEMLKSDAAEERGRSSSS